MATPWRGAAAGLPEVQIGELGPAKEMGKEAIGGASPLGPVNEQPWVEAPSESFVLLSRRSR